MINIKSHKNNLPFELSTIEGYKKAVNDKSCFYHPINLLQYTMVGKLTTEEMVKLNLHKTTPSSLYRFVNKETLRKMDEQYYKQTPNDFKHKVKVFSVLLAINPQRDIRTITPDEFHSICISISRLSIILKEMRSRCSNPNSQNWQWYGAKGVKVCDEWKNNTNSFVVWSIANGYIYRPYVRKGNQLSIDRIDSSLDYCPENCRWILHKVNAGRANHSRTSSSKQFYKRHGGSIIRTLAKQDFPSYRTSYGYLDWYRLFNEEFKCDWDKFNEYITNKGLRPQTIYNIRTKIRDCIEQNKNN